MAAGLVVVGLAAWGATIARAQWPATGATVAPHNQYATRPAASLFAPSSDSAERTAREVGSPSADVGPPGPVRPSVLGQTGVVLLRNGATVEGIITPAGDFYYVTVPDGQMRFRASEVRMVCRDLEDAYWRQHGALRTGDVMDRLRLAHWCLAQHMPGHAARELADAIQIDPTHPGIDYLRRRLRAQLDAVAGGDDSEGPAESLAVSPEELDRFVAGLPRGAVESYVATIQPMLQNNCTAAGCHGPQSDSEFRLMRAPADRPASRRLTQRNLHAVSRWIDFDDPQSSPLLIAAQRAHGGAVTPVFGPRRREQYDRLAQWVFELAGRPMGSVAGAAPTTEAAPVTPNPWLAPAGTAATSGDGPSSAAQSAAHQPLAPGAVVPARFDEIPGQATNPGPSGVAAAGCFEPIDVGNGPRGAGPPGLDAGAAPTRSGRPVSVIAQEHGTGKSAVRGDGAASRGVEQQAVPTRQRSQPRGGAVPRFLPADPFDPAIFNQRYFSPANESRSGG